MVAVIIPDRNPELNKYHAKSYILKNDRCIDGSGNNRLLC